MAPQRDPRYLAFIRTLPCCVPKCGCTRNIDAHHAGRHGMAQKADDRSAIPLCRDHHREIHNHGVVAFAIRYDLDIQALIRRLNKKPLILLEAGVYVGYLEGRDYPLGPRSIGMRKAIVLMRDRRREGLTEEWMATA